MDIHIEVSFQTTSPSLPPWLTSMTRGRREVRSRRRARRRPGTYSAPGVEVRVEEGREGGGEEGGEGGVAQRPRKCASTISRTVWRVCKVS